MPLDNNYQSVKTPPEWRGFFIRGHPVAAEIKHRRPALMSYSANQNGDPRTNQISACSSVSGIFLLTAL